MSDGMAAWEIWCFRLVVVAAVAWFGTQMATRFRLIQAAPDGFSVDGLGGRIKRFVSEVIFQSKTIRERPVVGIAHLFVFWGFCAFAGYTTETAPPAPNVLPPYSNYRAPLDRYTRDRR